MQPHRTSDVDALYAPVLHGTLAPSLKCGHGLQMQSRVPILGEHCKRAGCITSGLREATCSLPSLAQRVFRNCPSECHSTCPKAYHIQHRRGNWRVGRHVSLHGQSENTVELALDTSATEHQLANQPSRRRRQCGIACRPLRQGLDFLGEGYRCRARRSEGAGLEENGIQHRLQLRASQSAQSGAVVEEVEDQRDAKIRNSQVRQQ
mmetsp:Transcript_131582/g.420943  ORF Transcript_131582/g.420943 Transcript_131582/m.420943 type:complete len:206 (+) Transcript_131582:472-1089(+)